MSVATILKKIIDTKHEELALNQSRVPIQALRAEAEQQSTPRGFVDAMQAKLNQNKSAVIAEIKKASPSKGVIRPNFVPAEIAESYERGGAACLSVLTDVQYFQGSNDYLQQVRRASKLPVIRKDFIIDPYQIYEAAAIGADCILLIVAALDHRALGDLNSLANELGMDVLVEVHDEHELEQALLLPNKLVGINNRNLHDFSVSLDTTYRLLEQIPSDKIVVTESGIVSAGDVAEMRSRGVNSFLIGESFMRASDPGKQLQDLFA